MAGHYGLQMLCDEEIWTALHIIDEKANPPDWGTWLMGSDAPKHTEETKEEHVAAVICCMGRLVQSSQRMEINGDTATAKAAFFRDRISQIGMVDDKKVSELLALEGIDECTRDEILGATKDLSKQKTTLIAPTMSFFSCCSAPTQKTA